MSSPTVDVASTAPARSQAPTDPRSAGPVRRLPSAVAWAVAVVAAVAAYAVVAGGLLPLPLRPLVWVLVLLGVPTSGRLSRRVALNGSLLVGWTEVLWWVRWPVDLNHGAVVVAAAVGGTVLVAMRSRSRRRAVLLSAARPADALLLAAAAAGTWAMAAWAFAGSSRRALALLLPGADNYAHFHMFSTVLTHGAVTTSLGPAPDGPGWAFDNYPQGFHALTATVSQVLQPGLSAGTELPLAYARAVSLVVVLGIVTLVAAVVSLPPLRERPVVALPVVTLTCTAYLWAPGAQAIADGFANFWLAAAAAATALLLALSRRERLELPLTAAVAGLVVFVANAWAPMLVLAAPSGLALLSPFADTLRRAGRRRLLAAGAILVAGALGVLKALVALLTSVQVGTLVTAIGGGHGVNPLPAFLLLLAGLGVGLGAQRVLGAAGPPGLVRRLRVSMLSLLAGLALGTVLLVAQLQTVGTSSYYFVKFFVGFELTLAGFVPAICALLVASRWPAGRHGAAACLVWCVVLLPLATQAFGRFPAPRPPLSTYGLDGTASIGAPFDASRVADGILRAAAATTPDRSITEDYVAIGPDRAAEAFYPDGWFHGMLASLTARTATRVDLLRHHDNTVEDAVPLVRQVLVADPHVRVIVDPRYVAPVRRGLARPALAERVGSWHAAGR